MATAVELVATELSVGSFHNQRDSSNGPALLSPALQLNVFPKLGFGIDRVPQPQGSPVLPHWMDSKQIPSRSTDHGGSIEFLPEMGPSTPMQGTPKQKHNVETPQEHPDALLHSRGSQHAEKLSLPLELVEKSSGLKQGLQQSCSPPMVSEEQQSQKENMLMFSLGTSKSPVHATPKGQSLQQRNRVGQPPSTRALATLAASKISIAPEDLQLQQPVKGVQQPVLVESHRPAAACIAGASSKRGVLSSGALSGSIQLDLFRASSTSPQVYPGTGQSMFAPQFRAFPMASIADGTADGVPGKIASHLQGGSPQPEHWLRRSTLTSTVPRWLDVCTPGTGHAGTQWHERSTGFTSTARSPGMLLAPQTPFEGAAYASVLNGTPRKDCKQALEELEMKVYGNLSRKRKIASPEKVPKVQRSTGHNSPGQQPLHLDPKLAVAAAAFSHSRKLNGWIQREQPETFPGAQSAVEGQPQFSLDRCDASREHKFFPGRKAHQLGPAKATDGRVTPNGLPAHVQFVSPKKEQGSKLVVGNSLVASPSPFALINNFKNPQSSVQQLGAATPISLDCGIGKCYAVSAHSPMPVPDFTISAGEPSLPLSLNFAHKIAQGSKVQAKMTSMRSESDWGKSLALAANPITQDSPFRQRYAELQMYLKYCDEVRHDHLVEVFRSMSAAGRSGHALRLETRALWLNFEEGKEMDRIKSLNIMGAQSRDPKTRDLGELGCTPHGPRLPAPGNTPAS